MCCWWTDVTIAKKKYNIKISDAILFSVVLCWIFNIISKNWRCVHDAEVNLLKSWLIQFVCQVCLIHQGSSLCVCLKHPPSSICPLQQIFYENNNHRSIILDTLCVISKVGLMYSECLFTDRPVGCEWRLIRSCWKLNLLTIRIQN